MQAASAAQQALANKDQLNALQDKLKQQQAGLPKSLEDALKGRGAGGPGPGPGIGAGPLSREAMSAKLFPRASAVETGLVRSAVAGPVSGTPGAPGPAGAPAHGNNQGQNKDHKRADYLDSVEHLDEAIGTPPVVSRPVVDQ